MALSKLFSLISVLFSEYNHIFLISEISQNTPDINASFVRFKNMKLFFQNVQNSSVAAQKSF